MNANKYKNRSFHLLISYPFSATSQSPAALWNWNPIEFKTMVESLKNSQEGFSESSWGSEKMTLPSVGQFHQGARLAHGVDQPLLGRKDRAAHGRTAGCLTLPCEMPASCLHWTTSSTHRFPKAPREWSPQLTAPGTESPLQFFSKVSKSLTDLPHSVILKLQ